MKYLCWNQVFHFSELISTLSELYALLSAVLEPFTWYTARADLTAVVSCLSDLGLLLFIFFFLFKLLALTNWDDAGRRDGVI